MSKNLKNGIENLLVGINDESEYNIGYDENVIQNSIKMENRTQKSSNEITLRLVYDKMNDIIQKMQTLNSEQSALLFDITGEKQNEETLKENKLEGIIPSMYSLCEYLEKYITVSEQNVKKIKNILG